jgi:SAM-dependent methyltransferase
MPAPESPLSNRDALRTFYETSESYHHTLCEREADAFQGEYLRIVNAYIPAPARLLDLGCGTGYSSLRLAESGFDAVGMDLSRKFLSTASARTSRRLHYSVGDALELPFADATFDGVTSFYMIEHVVDVDGVLAEIRRVLRPGGRLVIICPNYWSPVIPLKALVNLVRKGYGFVSFYESIPEALTGIVKTGWGTARKICRTEPRFVYRAPKLDGHTDVDCDCVYLPSPVDFRRYFQKAGYRIVQYGREGSSRLRRWCATVAPSFIPTVYFVAEKPLTAPDV